METGNLEELEAKIDRLLERHERIKREKDLIERKLQQRETEWHQLRGQIRQYERERSELRDRIDRILGHLAHLDVS